MSGEELALSKCTVCHARFVPLDGPCPRCAAVATEPYTTPAVGVVLASTLLEVPPAGWPAPHRLALIEVEDGVRLLAIVDGELPAPGAFAEVRREDGRYRARAKGPAGRGEGDVPEAGRTRPSL